ncbi:hypothetical protein QYE76_026286 [Lolium multiflorum]|uniref:Retrotransposon Copia-like N-terminal domain-containing protein n=1 Tax=Lolium multiflorum TaxID=4521 RepID=A0AAD8RIG1_LOLMU|nr:hypothetical protein QYE76_026286 [Lolium multiflorum]
MASSSSVAPINLGNPPSEKLTRKNFPLWRSMVLPAIRGAQLVGLLDGSDAEPPKELAPIVAEKTADDQTKPVPNPAYAAWLARDQSVLSYLLQSLSLEIFPHVHRIESAVGVWKALEEMFAAQSKARVTNLLVALVNTKKLQMTTSEFLTKMQVLASHVIVVTVGTSAVMSAEMGAGMSAPVIKAVLAAVDLQEGVEDVAVVAAGLHRGSMPRAKSAIRKDSGATHHITGELNNLSMRDTYKGYDKVNTANGQARQNIAVGENLDPNGATSCSGGSSEISGANISNTGSEADSLPESTSGSQQIPSDHASDAADSSSSSVHTPVLGRRSGSSTRHPQASTSPRSAARGGESPADPTPSGSSASGSLHASPHASRSPTPLVRPHRSPQAPQIRLFPRQQQLALAHLLLMQPDPLHPLALLALVWLFLHIPLHVRPKGLSNPVNT